MGLPSPGIRPLPDGGGSASISPGLRMMSLTSQYRSQEVRKVVPDEWLSHNFYPGLLSWARGPYGTPTPWLPTF